MYNKTFNNFGSINDISLHQDFALILSDTDYMLLIDWTKDRSLYIGRSDPDLVSIVHIV